MDSAAELLSGFNFWKVSDCRFRWKGRCSGEVCVVDAKERKAARRYTPVVINVGQEQKVPIVHLFNQAES